MSRKSRRAGRQHARTLAYAATTHTLGQIRQRQRKREMRATDPAPTLRPDTKGWSADIARILADAKHPTVPRTALRAAMPDMGSNARNGHRTDGSTNGRRGSKRLGGKLTEWERAGWLRRDTTNDTVVVLDRAALRAYADRADAELANTQPTNKEIAP